MARRVLRLRRRQKNRDRIQFEGCERMKSGGSGILGLSLHFILGTGRVKRRQISMKDARQTCCAAFRRQFYRRVLITNRFGKAFRRFMNANKNKRSKLHNAIRTGLRKIPSSRRSGFRFRKPVAVPPTARAQPRYRFEATRELMICFGWLRLFRTILSGAERAR
jgi:hypothetical protein